MVRKNNIGTYNDEQYKGFIIVFHDMSKDKVITATPIITTIIDEYGNNVGSYGFINKSMGLKWAKDYINTLLE